MSGMSSATAESDYPPITEISGRDPQTGSMIRVTLDQGVITGVDSTESLSDSVDNPEDIYLSPGLVDLQVNGYSGLDLNDGGLTEATVSGLVRKIAALGVTSFLPTLITASPERLTDALAVIRSTRQEDPLATRLIVGVHIEGPSISPEDGPRGAHPRDQVRPPSLREFDAWQAAGGGLVSMVTVAPETDGALDYISALASRGIVVTLGHSHRSPRKFTQPQRPELAFRRISAMESRLNCPGIRT